MARLVSLPGHLDELLGLFNFALHCNLRPYLDPFTTLISDEFDTKLKPRWDLHL